MAVWGVGLLSQYIFHWVAVEEEVMAKLQGIAVEGSSHYFAWSGDDNQHSHCVAWVRVMDCRTFAIVFYFGLGHCYTLIYQQKVLATFV